MKSPQVEWCVFLWVILLIHLMVLACATEPTLPRNGCIITMNRERNRVFERVRVVDDDGDGNWVAILLDQHDKLKVRIPKEKVSFQCPNEERREIETRH